MTRAADHIRSGERSGKRSGEPGGKRPGRAGGFTYVGLIILVAIIGLVAATTLRVGITMQRAQAERDLLHIGEQFSDALQSYAAATPAGQPQQPPTLKELLKDPRYPGIKRHLRKIFVDPLTGKAEWGVIYMADNKGVLGIYSLSKAAPIKVSNFPVRFQGFDGKQKISDWVFTYNGQPPPPPGQLPPKPGQPGTPAQAPGTTAPGAPATPPAANPPSPMTGTPPAPAGEPAENPPETPPEPGPPRPSRWTPRHRLQPPSHRSRRPTRDVGRFRNQA